MFVMVRPYADILTSSILSTEPPVGVRQHIPLFFILGCIQYRAPLPGSNLIPREDAVRTSTTGNRCSLGMPKCALSDASISHQSYWRFSSVRCSSADVTTQGVQQTTSNSPPATYSPVASSYGPRPSSLTPSQPTTSPPSSSTEQAPLNATPGAHGGKLPQDQHGKKTREPFDWWWWWWDIAAALVSITAIALVVAILFRMHRVLSEWPLAIQPNTTIAILTTVGRAAIKVAVASCISQLKWRHMQQKPRRLHHLQIFDNASRGPW